MEKHSVSQQLEIFCEIISHILSVRSPHTGRHIRQVPILAQMIAKTVSKELGAKNKSFLLTNDDLQKIDIAAKLHDAGKTTTPDYLLEKSSKLEFPCNRIHEIRNRFEIMRRDAEIACLKKIIANPADKKTAEEDFKQTVKRLEQEFAFVAGCNIGDIEVTPADVKRLKTIGRQKFKRFFQSPARLILV